ncbi:MAG TPA: carboxypeptidase-like regulatory domain-containing protein [Pyrinomonadaceae bacterium]|jgi:hypothetical protein|nr:carboxypeptidase-like regulatory domain-containing protein [Pyrinomonadaceae bacterium]
MNKFHRSLTVTFVACWLFVCAVVIVVDPNAFAQTHEDIHSSALNLDHERVAAGETDPDPGKLSQVSTTSIVGKVLDPENRAMPRTTVTLTEAYGTQHTTISDSFGNFRFEDISSGQKVVLSANESTHSFFDLPVDLAGETTISWRADTKLKPTNSR